MRVSSSSYQLTNIKQIVAISDYKSVLLALLVNKSDLALLAGSWWSKVGVLLTCRGGEGPPWLELSVEVP